MRGFIKSLLKEQEEKYDTLAMLSDYTGNNSKLQDLSRELKVLGKLSNTKIKDAVTQFKKEFYEPTILSSLQFNKQIQSLIMDLGTKAYNDILRSNKRFLLSDLNKVKIGTPEREWMNRNVSDLRFFKRHITDTGEKFSFPDRNEKVSISDEVTNLLKLLVKRDFWGFIEGDEWSILNKINTNYTNWSKLIAKRDKEGDLGNNGSPKDKVTNYFKQRPIEERYIAARILESRDFQFKKINTYLRKWEFEKWDTPAKARRLSNPFRGGQSKIISIMMLLAMAFLGTFVIIPLFFPNSIFSFSFSGDIWFFLNIFSFVVFFYIFGFIGYF